MKYEAVVHAEVETHGDKQGYYWCIRDDSGVVITWGVESSRHDAFVRVEEVLGYYSPISAEKTNVFV